MLGKKKWIYLVLVILNLLSLSSCDSELIKSGNHLEKNGSDLPKTQDLTKNSPSVSISAGEDQVHTTAGKENMIKIQLVYDNYSYQEGLETSWGFSALVSYRDQNLLFDTGGDGSILLRNLAALDIDPTRIQNVVLSHEHSDHTGGMQALIRAGAEPKLYVPPSFSSEFKNNYSQQVEIVEVSPGLEIMDGFYSTGEMAGPPPEHALMIDTMKGLVVITGCAHPGIEDIVLMAKEKLDKEIYLVLGGFHLGSASTAEVNEIITAFKDIGVHYLAPCHCTGDQVISAFKNVFEEGFIQVGVGKVIMIEN